MQRIRYRLVYNRKNQLNHQGVAITTVQKVLGHTSVKTTQIYSEVLSDTIVRDLKSIRKRKRL